MTSVSSPSAPADPRADVVVVGTDGWARSLVDAIGATERFSPRSATSVAAALRAVREREPDCVVSAYELESGTGLELLRALRKRDAALPVVLCSSAADERIASDAVSAGVTEYVVIDASDEPRSPDDTPTSDGPRSPDDTPAYADRVVDAIGAAVETGRTRRERNRSARGFEAVFHDGRSATWLLDPSGSIRRANDTARTLGGSDSDSDADVPGAEGPFWNLPCWSGDDVVRRDVRDTIENAMAGRAGRAVVQHGPGEETRVTDLSVQPVRDERGGVSAMIVDAVDITERVGLERELRRSEELHRVTLNNMTDTVLITNEAGEYTYVCPNVHFIFGYTAEEIRDLGTIDELLGEELFDRGELADDGVLKNIECTATDKAGREHTLLVNVREVSIRDGTLLYSCRDVTKRKQREDALATLQGTAREFLYAETDEGIAERVVADAPDVVGVDAAAIYLFDEEANVLRPVASTSTMDRRHGPLSPVGIDDETLPGYSFVADEPLFLDDGNGASRFSNPATGLASLACVPLGDHGVFLAGSTAAGAFDEVARELVDLLAATAEAAFDRVARERRLREQERELQWRNSQLSALNRINETIREVDRALVRAETREEIDHAVCDLLTADDRFAFAWIGEPDAAGEVVEPRAWAGEGRGYLDGRSVPVSDEATEPAGRALATGTVTTVSNVASDLREAAWRTDALARDFLSVSSVPLVYNDLSYGVLTVYGSTQSALDETSKEVLAELGETIASAISALERRNALVSTSMTRIEFEVDDPSFVLTRIARDADCTLTYQGGVQRTADGTGVFVTVEDASVDAVAEVAESLVDVEDVQRIASDTDGGVLRLRLAQPFLATELADHGAVFRSASATPERTTIVIEVPDSVDVRHVTSLVRRTFDDVRLRSKQSRDGVPDRTVRSRLFEDLTPRQTEVIQTAYYGGFFESPRRNTGEEIAEMLGISSTAFYGHVRAVYAALFAALFAEDKSWETEGGRLEEHGNAADESGY
ncbi:bacterio-opsin activator domain-containing protein [Halorubrum sp. DTA98]|uniref:bacterio-opsin activator domain-containing protein n=1 Tax=Halorubrum sp. DTA98 TaxID=3402163 RepID=UPI003AB088BB